MNFGTLYIVPLPIGNLEDITLRAIRVLKSVDIVAAEDTRNFRELTTALQIEVKKVITYHDHNEDNSASGLLKLLEEGLSIALVSDAGTPGIADPGYSILNLCYKKQIRIEPLPGASSLVTALSACPLGGTTHTFFGFAHSKQTERKHQLQKAKLLGTRSVFFESPHRIIEHLKDSLELFGNIEIFIAREISKKFQEYLYKDIEFLISHFEQNPPRGEFVVVYPEQIVVELNASGIEDIIRKELAKGRSSKEILEILKGQSSLSRSESYDLIQKIKEDSKKS